MNLGSYGKKENKAPIWPFWTNPVFGTACFWDSLFLGQPIFGTEITNLNENVENIKIWVTKTSVENVEFHKNLVCVTEYTIEKQF